MMKAVSIQCPTHYIDNEGCLYRQCPTHNIDDEGCLYRQSPTHYIDNEGCLYRQCPTHNIDDEGCLYRQSPTHYIDDEGCLLQMLHNAVHIQRRLSLSNTTCTKRSHWYTSLYIHSTLVTTSALCLVTVPQCWPTKPMSMV